MDNHDSIIPTENTHSTNQESNTASPERDSDPSIVCAGCEYPSSGMRYRFCKFLSHRHSTKIIILIAVCCTLPSLWGGFVGDDDHIRLRLTAASTFTEQLPEIANNPLDLFRFTTGDPDFTLRLMDIGLWPWWTLPELRVCFWRPLTSITHWIDFQLFPNTPALMHLHSIVWFVVVIFTVGLFFKRLMGVTVMTSLALLLYAIDDARTLPAAWLSNRNALISLFFGLLCLLTHMRWRREQWKLGLWLAPVFLVLSLLAKEEGISTCAYLFAYAVFLDHGSWKKRFGTLLPYTLVVVVWRFVWSFLGYGIVGADLYVDPLSESGQFLLSLIERFPIYLMAQWLLPPSDLYGVSAIFGRFPAYYLTILAVIGITGIAMVVIPRLRWNALTKFWATGMLLSIIPVCAAFPGDRVLGFTGLGGAALLAQFLNFAWLSVRETNSSRLSKLRSRMTGCMVVAFVVVHFALSPLLFAVRSAFPMGPPTTIEQMHPDIAEYQQIEEKSVIIVNSLIPLFSGFLSEHLAVEGKPFPAHTRVLSPCQKGSTHVFRTDLHTLEIRPAKGFMYVGFDRLARGQKHMLLLGDRVELTGMSATVTSMTSDQRPAEVSFEFSQPLEDSSLIWFYWKSDHFEKFIPPPVGEGVTLEF